MGKLRVQSLRVEGTELDGIDVPEDVLEQPEEKKYRFVETCARISEEWTHLLGRRERVRHVDVQRRVAVSWIHDASRREQGV